MLRPPSNTDILGSQLLGYRVYIRDIQCTGTQKHCQERQKKTISDPTATKTTIGLLSMIILFEIRMFYFCGKMRKTIGLFPSLS